MIAGPIFRREVLTLPRQFRHYLIRSGYIGLLFVLLWTAGQVTFGFQDVRGTSAMAGFGEQVFRILGFVQLSLVLFFSLLFTAGNIAQEKDRQTLILLLMTDLSNREIVLGKLFASVLQVGTLILVSAPVFFFLQLLGGITPHQIFWLIVICFVTALLSGSWAALIAFWKEKTFQTLATSVLGLVVYLGAIETVIAITPSHSMAADWAAAFSPFRAVLEITSPLSDPSTTVAGLVPALDSVIGLCLLSAVLTAISINRLRIWNPSRTLFVQPETEAASTESGTTGQVVRHRRIWSNPVIWREMRTRAYGRRVVFIKLAYLLMAATVFYNAILSGDSDELILGMVSRPAFAFVGLGILGLVLINAQAATSITSERDGQTLDLLVATDISAKEFVYGKLGGVFYNTKELALVPLAISAWFVAEGSMSLENGVYLSMGFLSLVAFAAMLGLHSGLGFASSRQAIANSMGTIFFLFIGIFILMILLVETRGSFGNQIGAFILFIGVGSLGLGQSLTYRNPSPALWMAGGLLPVLTFYAITTFLLNGTLGVCLSIAAAYGFTTLAMLVPAVSEFDVALGRSTSDKG
ncbi:MAG: ABC transporter permease [Planctomycetota bacterium]|nr:ABC transporter permease [Planctomycetota bacterium]